jgi:sulfoacetaldehyde dehydrogenase
MNNRIVNQQVLKAREAQSIIENYSQEKVDELILAVAWEVIKPENNQYLSELAVRTTGLGNVEDKKKKNKRKTIGLLRDLKDIKSVGVINRDFEKGIIEIARPVGLVGAIIPSTNPIATPLNKVINALKCRNSIILAPSPKGASVCAKVVDLIHLGLKRVHAPTNLVQSLPAPVNFKHTTELMQLVDLVVATGAQDNIKKAIQTGTPTIGVGVGNVPSIIDSSADLKITAHKIKISKTFDNSTSCSSENSLVIIDSVYDKLIEALENEGGALLSPEEKKILGNKMWNENHILNRKIIAKEASEIAISVGLDKIKFSNSKFLMVEENGIGEDYPFSKEKLSPVLAVYRARDFNHAVKLTKKILQNQGQGHSCSIHSKNEDNITKLGMELPVCRVIVNQAHCFATGGSFDNGLPFSLSMGCGTWGKNISDENLNYKHYLNVTKIVKTIKSNEPSESEIFSSYWEKFNPNVVI